MKDKEPILPDLRIAEVSTCHSIQFFNVDCMEFMRSKPDKYYDLAIVDPPYGIDEKLYRSSHGKNKNSAIAKFYKNDNRWDIAPMPEYFTELFRISKNQIIWGGNYFDLPISRGFICWDKIRPPENSFSDFELAWSSFDKMPKMFRFGANGGFVAKNEDRFKIHPTQKPITLYRWILQNYATEGTKIIDTHGGSMSIAIACDEYKCSLDVCEIDLEYFTNGVKRFKEYKSQQRLF